MKIELNYIKFWIIEPKSLYLECKLVAAPGKYDFKPYAIGYQKHSPYADILDYHIEKMREAGVLDNIKERYMGFPQKCPDFR